MLSRLFDWLGFLLIVLLILVMLAIMLGGACWIAFWIWQHVFAFFI